MKFIIYHQVKKGLDCPDGIHAAAIMAMKYPNATLIGDCYRDEKEYGDRPFELPEFNSGDEVIIVDFSYPYAWLKYWEEAGVKITVIDHHAQKFGMLQGFTGAILDENECGTTLAWREVFPNKPIPEILRHVRNRDIGTEGYYEGTNPDSEMIAEGLSQLRHKAGRNKILFLQTILLNQNAVKQCREAGREAVEKKYEVTKIAAQRHIWRIIAGYKVPFVQLKSSEDRYASAIGNALCRNYAPELFSWVRMSDGSSSLRSAGFDVSVIAAQYGGGGHTKAAGFQREVVDNEI